MSLVVMMPFSASPSEIQSVTTPAFRIISHASFSEVEAGAPSSFRISRSFTCVRTSVKSGGVSTPKRFSTKRVSSFSRPARRASWRSSEIRFFSLA